MVVPGVRLDCVLGIESIIQGVLKVYLLALFLDIGFVMVDRVDVEFLEDLIGWDDIGRGEGDEGEEMQEFHIE